MADDPQPMTLQQRIAALNAAHISRVPGDPAPPIQRSKPDVPARRPPIVKHNTVNIPNDQVLGSVADSRVGNKPNGPPPQLPSRKQPPPLPSRDSSEQSSRRPSVTSTTSVATTDTSSSRAAETRTKSSDSGRIKAPAWGQADLPPLPPKSEKKTTSPIPERPKFGTRGPSFSSRHSTTTTAPPPRTATLPPKQTLPPPLPTRKSTTDLNDQQSTSETLTRKLPPVPSAASLEKARLAAFSNNSAVSAIEPKHPNSQRHGLSLSSDQCSTSAGAQDALPPPVPLASRPDLAALQATKPKFAPSNAALSQGTCNGMQTQCMTCRDFSQPDEHAARFPRQSVTSLPVLAQQLTSPFSSFTDKARAIFTWLHYNISYDVVSFFGNNVKGSTPQSTLQTGLAVCEGYAALFANLATAAGMEAVVVGGDGKGFGYEPLPPGSAVPPFSTNHAWNAVKIDDGEWKLIDPCWGAGHVQGAGLPYEPHFTPSMFTMSNEEFGIKHFPENQNYFFLPGGRILSWQDYALMNPERWPYDCDRPTIFTNARTDYFLGERTLLPYDGRIRVNSPTIVRFQFSLLCEHFTLERHTNKGRPPVFIIATHGVDGRKEDLVPLEHVKGTTPGGGGDFWYADIPAQELGAPGQKLTLFAITTFGDRKHCRGMTVREFRQGKGKVGYALAGVAAWELI